MSEKSSWAQTKKTITIALAILLAADVAAGVFLWRTSRQRPEQMRAEVQQLTLQAKLRQADVARGQKIRASLPQVGKDCSQFYQSTFLTPETGYSTIDADLSSIADKAGLHISDTNFKQSETKTHGVKEISISTSVEGNYASIIQFISGLEQSRNFYLLNDLQLTSAKGGAIKLNLKLRSFFRA